MGPFGPRPFMLMQQPQPGGQLGGQPGGQPSAPVSIPNGVGSGAVPNVSSSSNCNGSNSGFLQNFHQSVVGDLRAGKLLFHV